MKLQLAKGMNDSMPEEMIIRQRLMDDLKVVFEQYGFSPIDTPAIERFDILSAKYAGGAEILKETFKLKDQGKRDLGLRYDLTVPFSRLVGMHPNLKTPFKRYQMAKVWRDGPIGMGRYREFWQCDVDMVGTKRMSADAEILSISKAVFEKFDLPCTILLNNRRLLSGMINSLGVTDEDKKMEIILIIDKIKKIKREQLVKELKEAGLSDNQVATLEEIFKITGDSKKKLKAISKYINDEEGKAGIEELEELFSYLDAYGMNDSESVSYELEFSLTRGLAFYTGTVFETYLKDSPIKSAVASGGRYDKIIGSFLESNQEFPCVGTSFGLSRIADALEQKGTIKRSQTVTEVFVAPIGLEKEAIPIAEEFRRANIKTEMDLCKRGMSKNLKYANAKEIPYVVFVGENELKAKKFKMRNMQTGDEVTGTVEELIKSIRK